MEELTNRVVALDDVLGRGRASSSRACATRPAGASASRCSTRRCCVAWPPGRRPRPRWRGRYARLAAADGRLAVGPLADEVGWSRRHLAARWRRDVGMGPKAVARVLRFQRALRLLRAGRGLADVAYDCGFADQPHLNREFRALGGSTPREVTFVQDAAARPV